MLNGALPPFDPEGGSLLVAARAVSDAALMQVFGAAVARLAYAAPMLPPDVERRLAALLRVAGALAVVALLTWLWLQATAFADAAPNLAGLRDVAFGTWFGQVLTAQVVLAVLAMAALGSGTRKWQWGSAALAATVALAVEGLHGHAWAMRATTGSGWLVASVVLHLLAAGAWLGGLLPLAVLLADPARWRPVLTRFSKLGYVCVAALAATAGAQAWTLVGGLPALFGTTYGLVALAKLAGFAILVGIACLNRWRLGPRRSAWLRPVIVVEAAVGVGVVAAACLLAALPPAMHVQPVRPFARRPTLAEPREQLVVDQADRLWDARRPGRSDAAAATDPATHRPAP